MAGNKEGAAKAKQTIINKYGTDYYSKMGKLGGSVPSTRKGFAANPALARVAGRKGGRMKGENFRSRNEN